MGSYESYNMTAHTRIQRIQRIHTRNPYQGRILQDPTLDSQDPFNTLNIDDSYNPQNLKLKRILKDAIGSLKIQFEYENTISPKIIYGIYAGKVSLRIQSCIQSYVTFQQRKQLSFFHVHVLIVLSCCFSVLHMTQLRDKMWPSKNLVDHSRM